MKVLISGATGLVGTALTAELNRAGHSPGRLVRPDSTPSSEYQWTVPWNPATGDLDALSAAGVDAAIHLAGASIAGGRWTASRKNLLRSSRVQATRNLVRGLAKLPKPPGIFVSASAIGYYGDRGDEILTENSAPGSDFLASLCRDWEAAAQEAKQFGARVAILRFGIILACDGGALPRIMLPFRFGMGGRLGSGCQWMSWIALQDVANLLVFALEHDDAADVMNAVAPEPVRNSDFTEALSRVMNRPAFFPAPAFMLKAALGEMAEALLLSSQRVLPERALLAGYSFRQPSLEGALRAILP